jgi:hypothetical protein
MRLSPLIFLTLLPVIAACTATSPDASKPAVPLPGVTVTLELSASTDELATVHTRARLNMTGVVQRIMDLGEVQGALQVVKSPAYDLYQKPNSKPLLILTSWWAGAGDEFILSQTDDGVMLQKRSGDEQGNCTALETLAEVELPTGTPVKLAVPSTEHVDQSSLKFCAEKDVVGADGIED